MSKQMEMSAIESADDAAERILKLEGFTFALAVSAGKEGDLKEARKLLKTAIVTAILSARKP